MGWVAGEMVNISINSWLKCHMLKVRWLRSVSGLFRMGLGPTRLSRAQVARNVLKTGRIQAGAKTLRFHLPVIDHQVKLSSSWRIR